MHAEGGIKTLRNVFGVEAKVLHSEGKTDQILSTRDWIEKI